MSKTHPAQRSFTKGEIVPKLFGRTDTEVYNQGLARCMNMYADYTGAALSREGFHFSFRLASGNLARVEVFARRKGDFFVYIFTHQTLYFIRNIFNPSITQTISAPWTEDQLDEIYIVPLPDGRTFYLFHPNVQTQKLIDAAGTTGTQTFNTGGTFIVPASVTEIAVCICGGGGGGGGLTGSGSTFTGGSGGGGSGVTKSVVTVTPAENIPVVIGAGGAGGADNNPGIAGSPSTFTAVSATLTSNAGAGGLAGSGGGGAGGSAGGRGGAGALRPGLGGTGGDCAAVCEGTAFLGITPQSASGSGGAGGYGGESYTNLVPDPNRGFGGSGGDDFGFLLPGFGGSSGKCVVTWEVPSSGITLTPVTFTAAPAEWTAINWPSCGAYFQSRLWMGGEPDFGERFLASKPGSPENLTVGVTDTDALSFIMEEYGKIEWMDGNKTLLIGTETGEFAVSAQGGVVTPSDIQVDWQSGYGSAGIQPVRIGDQIIYITPDGLRVQAINFEERKNNWMTTDLTSESSHITAPGIKQIAWAQHPNNLLWCLLDDGTAACLSYKRDVEAFGWHKHDTQGKILSLAAGFDGTRSVVIAAVERTTGQIDLEYLTFSYSMDSWIETSVITPYNDIFYVEGYDHLEGKFVQVTVDDAVHPMHLVGGESEPGEGDGVVGRIYILAPGNKVVAGLNFTPEIVTLPVDGGAATGSALFHKKRRNKIAILVLNSGLPLINGERGNDRHTNTPMDNIEPLITGQISGQVGLGWGQGQVSVKQDLPLPLNILAVFGEIEKEAF